ncbi:MAG: sulfite exporter TauE/SafE family protein, partial [Candidatus Geothermincolia bacterium]
HYLMFATGAMVLYVSVMTIRRGISERPTPADIDEAPVAERMVLPGEEHLSGERVPPGPPEDEQAAPAECVPSARMALLIGLAAGLMSGLLGVGGGVLLIPGFLYLLRMPIRRAFATSLAVITVIAIPGTIVHSLLHHISWSLVLYLVIGSIPGAYLGARLNLRTTERLLYLMFGALLGVFGVLFIVNEIISMTR